MGRSEMRWSLRSVWTETTLWFYEDCAPRHWHLAWLQNVQVSVDCTKCKASHTEQAAPQALLISWAARLVIIDWCTWEHREEHSPSLGSAPASGEPTGAGTQQKAPSCPTSLSPPESHWLLQPHPCTHWGQQQSLFRHCKAFVLPTDIHPGDGCRDREYLLVSLLHRGKETLQCAYVAWQNTLLPAGDD